MVRLKQLSCDPLEDAPAFPFSLPFVRSIERIQIDSDILIFVGENGSGKSTLLEALAIASKRISIGSTDLEREPTLAAVQPLARRLRLGWSSRTSKGFFLRAEDFFGFVRRNQELEREFDGFIDRFSDDDRVRGYMQSNKAAINARYGRDLNDCSHGEGFLTFFKSRISPGGLYLIDEPEAALSPQRQLAFILFVHDMAQQGCQFIIATHSPILLSCPRAQIWAFGESGIVPSAYEDIEHVRFMKSFLAAPDRYWRRMLEQ